MDETPPAVTRAEHPKSELIRFAASPAGGIVPDIAGDLPGRGVWVTATAAAVAEAGRRNVFAKSLKRQVEVPADLAGVVERLLVDRVRQSLSFANKAGLVTIGFAKVDSAIAAGDAVVLVQAHDASEDGLDKLARKFTAVSAAGGRAAPVVRLLSVNEMSLAMGRPNVVHAVLAEGGQCRSFLGAALRLHRYRQSELTAELAWSGHTPSAPKGSGTEAA